VNDVLGLPIASGYLGWPVSQPPRVRHSASNSGPAAMDGTVDPPPPSNVRLWHSRSHRRLAW
jgi:hypothetical protein